VFRRVFVANRGEIARRIIRTCREMGIESVAAFSDADRDAEYLGEATDRVRVGPGPSARSYLDRDAILRAAIDSECQALHPGYGFLSEDPIFAEMCLQARLAFIGPAPRAIRLMGLKSAARARMREAGIPVIPGSDGVVASEGAALEAAARAGYPVLLKADSGGGGRGIRRCADPGELSALLAVAQSEARAAFGSAALYVEKLVTPARHVEFQVIGDAWGNLVSLGERECSVQRRHQKLLEEAPSPAVTAAVRAEVGGWVTGALAAIGYSNAGTVEFLLGRDGFSFLEMNTRLQVEHPVTEMVAGVDIVRLQIEVAANRRLDLRDVRLHGHAMECRITAEEPGTITAFEADLAAGPGRVRIDTHLAAGRGYRIPPHYDSLLAKVIAWGSTRMEAIETMRRALAGLRIDGVPTSVPIHRRLLETAEFLSGDYDTGILERLGAA